MSGYAAACAGELLRDASRTEVGAEDALGNHLRLERPHPLVGRSVVDDGLQVDALGADLLGLHGRQDDPDHECAVRRGLHLQLALRAIHPELGDRRETVRIDGGLVHADADVIGDIGRRRTGHGRPTPTPEMTNATAVATAS